MLRQLIGQVQELFELCGPHSLERDGRWCILDFGNSTMEHDFCNFVEGKSGPLKIVEANKFPPTKKCRREKSRQKGDIMEQQIWKDLPEDLMEAVVARLPVATIFRLRLVCSRWNSWITSASFSQQYAEVPRAHPWFYTTTTYENVNIRAMYDPSMKKWHHSSIPSLPSWMTFFPVASAGGLICFMDISHRNFYVCNPLNCSFKELPSIQVKAHLNKAVGMILNGKTADSGYKIIWLDDNGNYQVYNSMQNIWSCSGNLPPSIKRPLYLNLRSQSVSIGSMLYFMCVDPDGILCYDVATCTWRQFLIPYPEHVTNHMLAASGDQVLLVGLLSKNAATCIGVWELQKMTLLWKEVDRMPNIWCLDFYGKHVKMTCLGNRKLLMLSLVTSGRSRRLSTPRVVTYNILKREWQRLPDCKISRGRKRLLLTCGTVFDPFPSALA
ncbi:putative F-box domain, galactose oxidase/kelch, beta-propeller, kelch-type beta propeller [Dioscorea sansibarensis]